MEDYEKNVQKLQQWMTDTKQMTLSSEPSSGSMTLPGHLQLHQVSFEFHIIIWDFLGFHLNGQLTI